MHFTKMSFSGGNNVKDMLEVIKWFWLLEQLIYML